MRARWRGVAQTCSAHDKFTRHLPATELESTLRLAMVLQGARDEGNSDGGPEGDSGRGRFKQNRVRVPGHQGANPGVDRLGSVRQGVDPRRHGAQITASDEPPYGTANSGCRRRVTTPAWAGMVWISG
jgi:hypothetical protein